jgi:hypothetical protein
MIRRSCLAFFDAVHLNPRLTDAQIKGGARTGNHDTALYMIHELTVLS